jgi:hypothetical protein
MRSLSNMTRPQLVIVSLFYPALLGNMSYAAAEKLFNEPENFNWTSRFVVVALLVHFVFDWVYTVVEQEKRYSIAQFVSDSGIVVCLYVALRLVLDDNPPSILWCMGLAARAGVLAYRHQDLRGGLGSLRGLRP